MVSYDSFTEFYYNELYPSAIMFGMPSIEFWDDEPQLYWAYRFSYEKEQEYEMKKQIEQTKFSCWLNGKATEVAVSIALNNAFNKKKEEYPSYKKFFENEKQSKIKQELVQKLEGVTDREERGNIEYNYWARM